MKILSPEEEKIMADNIFISNVVIKLTKKLSSDMVKPDEIEKMNKLLGELNSPLRRFCYEVAMIFNDRRKKDNLCMVFEVLSRSLAGVSEGIRDEEDM